MIAFPYPQTTPEQAREMTVRRIFANVLDRSFGFTKTSLRLRRDLELKGSEEDEISYRINRELGVRIAPIEWSGFVTINDVVLYVEFETQRALAVGE